MAGEKKSAATKSGEVRGCGPGRLAVPFRGGLATRVISGNLLAKLMAFIMSTELESTPIYGWESAM